MANTFPEPTDMYAAVVQQLRAGDPALLGALYDSAFPKVAAHIRKNNGDTDDARDVFQEAMIALVEQAGHEHFTLTAAPGTYLFAISRNLWLKRLRERTRHVALAHTSGSEASEEHAFDTHAIPSAEERAASILDRITDHCVGILRALFMMRMPMPELMARMGWRNRHTADNQKYKCLQQARKAALR